MDNIRLKTTGPTSMTVENLGLRVRFLRTFRARINFAHFEYVIVENWICSSCNCVGACLVYKEGQTVFGLCKACIDLSFVKAYEPIEE